AGNGKAEPFATPGKVAGHVVNAGDVVMVRSAGGGGYGDPLERDGERVAADLAEGYISAAAAHDVYGVVVDERHQVDVAATRALRQPLRLAPVHPPAPS